MRNKKAVVLLSGGLDSATCLAIALNQGYECHALSCNYDQRSQTELIAAKKVSAAFNVSHKIIHLEGIGSLGGSALTDKSIEVPSEIPQENEIPITYVPGRNIIFLSCALSYAEVLNAHTIFIGVNIVDYSNYPDCTPEFMDAFQNVAGVGTKIGKEGQLIRLEAPLQFLNKAEIIRQGHSLDVDYSLTISCYQANEKGQACGTCSSCQLRKKGFEEAGITDPTFYRD